jgi:hypothetical protein
MPGKNEDYKELVQSTQDFCSKERSAATGSPFDHAVAAQLRTVFERVLPELAPNLANAPDPVYARTVIKFAVHGLKHEVITVLWEEYYTHGIPLEDVAAQVNYTPRTVRRFIASFPERIVRQLWEIQIDISAPPPIPIQTLHQRAKRILEDEFDLTYIQDGTLLAFCYGRYLHLSWREVTEGILCRSVNTTKTHFRRFQRNFEVSSRKKVIDKALDTLVRRLGDEWDEYVLELTLEKLQRLFLEPVSASEQ